MFLYITIYNYNEKIYDDKFVSYIINNSKKERIFKESKYYVDCWEYNMNSYLCIRILEATINEEFDKIVCISIENLK